MDFQDLIEQSYLKLSTKEHRKEYAQFFTPPAIASLMAAYILDNKECTKILDPANGLSIFARALDEHLKLINHRTFVSFYQIVNTLSYASWPPINQANTLRFYHSGAKRSNLSSLFYNYDELIHILALSQLPLELCLDSHTTSSLEPTSDINGLDSLVNLGASLAWITASNRLAPMPPSEAASALNSISEHAHKHARAAYLNTDSLNGSSLHTDNLKTAAHHSVDLQPASLPEAGGKVTTEQALETKPSFAYSYASQHNYLHQLDSTLDHADGDEVDNDDDNGLFAANYEAAKLRAMLHGSTQEQQQLEPALHGTECRQINASSLLLKHQYHAPAALNVQQIEPLACNLYASSKQAQDASIVALHQQATEDQMAQTPLFVTNKATSKPPSAKQEKQRATENAGNAANMENVENAENEVLCISTSSSMPERKVQLAAFEVDPIIAEFASLSSLQIPFSFVDVKFRLKDYIKSNFKDRYDGIICNPPYKTFKEFARKSQSITVIEERLDLKLSGRTNLYALFLLKSLYQLKPNGRCAYLIPYEFLNSSFGIKIKEQFLKQRNLAYVITFDLQGPIFDNATTTCGLFLFDNAKEQTHVEFITLHTIDEIEQLMIRLCPNLIASYPESHQSFQRYLSLRSQEKTQNAQTLEHDSLVSKTSTSAPSLLEGLMHTMGECRQVSDELKQALALSPCLISTLPNPMLGSLLKQVHAVKSKDTLQAKNKTQGQTNDHRTPSLQASAQTHTVPTGSLCQGRIVPYSQLKAKQKWHIYYQDRSTELPKATSELMHKSNLATFDQFIKVKRGLATGANEFFLFNRSKVESTKIPLEYFVKVIPRANLIQRPIFTAQDLQELEAQDALVYLLNAPNQVADLNLKRYLALGEAQDIHRRYLTRHRCPWYALERRQVAPILVSVFNRGSLHVIRNEAQIFNLTTFHSIFVLEEAKTDLIFAYLLTDLAKDIILQNRREYGGGLEKLEPLDINHAACIDFNQLTVDEEQVILDLYAQYRTQILANTPASLNEATLLLGKIAEQFQALL